SASIPFDKNPPFDLNVEDGTDFPEENGQIQVGAEIMGFTNRLNGVFHINKRGETFGISRAEHLIGERVTNQGYVLRARAMNHLGVFGAESAIKLYRVDLSPPTIPGSPISDQEISKTPSEKGVFSIKWTASGDSESGVRAYELQEREDNDPVWKSIRLL